jgi:amidohydrolase
MRASIPAIAAVVLAATTAQPDAVESYLRAHEADFISLRRQIHQHPELSGAESRTAATIAGRMTAAGLDVQTGVGGHGVVAILRGARPGPLVAYRADMDAVRSGDPDPVEFRSATPGVRHICGHDVHTAIAVAVAEALASVRAGLRGSVMFIFQPAEETATGARAMLEAGLFASETPVAIFGLHTSPLEVGTFGVRSGAMMAARDRIRVTVGGSGDLQSVAGSVRDLLAAASTLAPDQAFRSSPDPFSMVVVGPPAQRSGGGLTIAAQVTVANAEARARVRRHIDDGLRRLEGTGVTIASEYEDGAVAAGVTNDAETTRRAIAAIRGARGQAAVIELSTIIPAFSEDFGVFQARVPGTFFFLGVSNTPRGIAGMPHSPGYVADEGAIVIGARAMAAVLIDAMTG